MTLSELTTQFTGLMNRRDLTANTSLVTTFINQSIMRIQRELRIPAMEKSVLVTIANGYTGLVIPSDMIELISLIPQSNNANPGRLDKVDLSQALWESQFTGAPVVYSRQGGLWILGPAPGVGDVIRIDYYAELSPLVNPTDTNIMSIIAWDLIVYGALSQAALYYKDVRRGSTVNPATGEIVDGFEGEYNRIKNALQDMADADELDGTAAVQLCHRFPSDFGGGIVDDYTYDPNVLGE